MGCVLIEQKHTIIGLLNHVTELTQEEQATKAKNDGLNFEVADLLFKLNGKVLPRHYMILYNGLHGSEDCIMGNFYHVIGTTYYDVIDFVFVANDA